MENRWIVSLSTEVFRVAICPLCNYYMNGFKLQDAAIELITFGLNIRGEYVTVRDYEKLQRIETAIWHLMFGEKNYSKHICNDNSVPEFSQNLMKSVVCEILNSMYHLEIWIVPK